MKKGNTKAKGTRKPAKSVKFDGTPIDYTKFIKGNKNKKRK